MVMPYHLHMPSYFLETFTEYPYVRRYSLVWMYVQKRVYTRSLCISLNAFHLFLLNLCIDFVSELYRIGDKVKFVGDPACSNYNRTKTEHTSHEALINPYSFAFV